MVEKLSNAAQAVAVDLQEQLAELEAQKLQRAIDLWYLFEIREQWECTSTNTVWAGGKKMQRCELTAGHMGRHCRGDFGWDDEQSRFADEQAAAEACAKLESEFALLDEALADIELPTVAKSGQVLTWDFVLDVRMKA